jgi:hypothetical protein
MLEVLPISRHLLEQALLICAPHALSVVGIRSHRITVHLTACLRLLKPTSPVVPIFLLSFSIIPHLSIKCSHPTRDAHILHTVILPEVVKHLKLRILLLLGVLPEVEPKSRGGLHVLVVVVDLQGVVVDLHHAVFRVLTALQTRRDQTVVHEFGLVLVGEEKADVVAVGMAVELPSDGVGVAVG